MNRVTLGLSLLYTIGGVLLVALSWRLYDDVGSERGSEYIVATIFLTAIGWWLLAAKTLTPNLTAKKLALSFGGLTLLLSAVFVFLFASIYTGERFHESIYSRAYVSGLLLSYIMAVLVGVFSPVNLLYGAAFTDTYSGFTYTSFSELPALPLFAFASYLLIGYGALSLFRYWNNAAGSSNSTQLVISGVLFAVVANLITISLDESILAVLPWSSTGMLLFGILTTLAVRNGIIDIESITGPVFDNTSNQVFVLNSEGDIVDYNSAVTQNFLNIPHQDYINGSISQHPIFAALDITTIADFEDVDKFETVSQDAKHWYQPDVTSIEFSGDRDGYLLILQEATDEVEYVKKVEQRKRDLEQFSSAITHDVRNPLNVTTGNLKMAQEQLESSDNDTVLKHVDTALDASTRINQIITDMYEIIQEKSTNITLSPTSIEPIVTGALSSTDLEDSLTVDIQETQIEADANKLQIVFENLLKNSNAHGGDTITIYTETQDTGLGSIIYEDNGPGIDEDIATKIFEYGYSDGGSSGYGMSIIQAVIESHDWEINVDTSYDDGARFVITGVKITQDESSQSSAESPTGQTA